MQVLKTVECKLIPSEWIPSTKENTENDCGSLAFPSEETWCEAWWLSVISTQLCTVLNENLQQHDDFETWKQDGAIPDTDLKNLWNLSRSTSPYQNIPERFCRSAWLRVKAAYASWLAKRAKIQDELNRLSHWLNVVKSDLGREI